MARIVCLFLLLPFHSAVSEDYNNPLQGVNSPQRAEYVCNINESWLEHLENNLLNKSSSESVFKYCKSNYEQIKNCCTDPLNCKHKELKHISQNLKEESLTKAKEAGVEDFATCSLNNLQSLLASLNGTHNQVCNTGIKTCEDVCKDKLITLQNAFRDSFMIPDNYSIDEILKKAQSPPANQANCYNKMKEMAKKYKDQTLHKRPFRQRLKVRDILDCDKISLANTRQSLNSFALNVCREAQSQKQVQVASQAEVKRQQEISAQQTRDKKLALTSIIGGGAVLGASTQTKHQQSKPQAQYQYQYQRNQSQNQKIQAKYQQPQAKYQQTQIQPQYQKNPVYPPPYIPSEKEAKEEESFLNRLKSGYFSIVDKIKSIFVVKKVEKLCIDKGPPMHLGQITYQTVKAPQIERLNQEGLRPYNDYDLIQGKASGVMVKIRKSSWARKAVNLDRPKHYKKDISDFLKKQSFGLSLSIKGKEDKEYKEYTDILCSQLLTEKIVKYETKPKRSPEEEKLNLTKDHCTLKWSEIKDNKNIYKFIPLPTEKEEMLGEASGRVDVKILLQPIIKKQKDVGFQDTCKETEEFKLNILKPRKFKISLIGIKPRSRCKGSDESNTSGEFYTSTKEKDVTSFYNSDELQKHIYKMFPITKDSVTIEKIKDNFLGTCTRGDRGIIKDFKTLHNMIEEGGFDRIVYIVPENYRSYHGYSRKSWIGRNYSTLPSITVPRIYQWDYWWSLKPNVSVVLKDYTDEYENKISNIDEAVVLHELAHSLGQLKEGYEDEDHVYYCAQVTKKGILPGKTGKNKTVGIYCPNYRITGGLTKRYNKKIKKYDWLFLNNQSSIMNNVGVTIEGKQFLKDKSQSPIYNKWIDRETYQKILDTIQEGEIKPDYWENIKWQAPGTNTLNPKLIQASIGNASCDLKKRPILKIEGIYNKEDGSLEDFSIKTKIGNIENSFRSNKSFSKNTKKIGNKEHIKIQIKKNNKVEGEVHIEKEFSLENITKDGHKIVEMDFIPIYMSFSPSCTSFNEQDWAAVNTEGRGSYRSDWTISVIDTTKKGEEKVLIDNKKIQWKKEETNI